MTLATTQQEHYHSLLPRPHNDGFHAFARDILQNMVNDHHATFLMEYCDRPNILIRLLVSLHELGANESQIANIYNRFKHDLMPLRMLHVTIHTGNWQEYLGDALAYGDLLVFFDREMDRYGMDGVLDRYFYNGPLCQSFGSQMQPMIHLAFGIEQGLPRLVTQGLAYLATTYLDIMSFEEEEEQTTTTATAICTGVDQLLFDLVSADQRFDGKIDGGNSFHSAVKVLLKAKSDLLKPYLAEWTSLTRHNTASERIEQLVMIAIQLITRSSSSSSSSQTDDNNNSQIALDWYLGGGQLLASALAIYTLVQQRPDLDLRSLTNLQFLNTLCSFIVQGRPSSSHPPPPRRLEWSDCIATIIESNDANAILTMRSLCEASKLYPHHNDLMIDTANFLVNFVHNGVWIKGGIGWNL